MTMNVVIQEQRRKLGLTQEQVAEHLGVSTPAVSKWENGVTTPDIGLLPALARLLKIDLNTLFSFQEELTAQEIGLFCNELGGQAREDIFAAFEAAEAKFRAYPHNEQLLLNAAIVLDSMLLQRGEPAVGLDSRIADWYLRLSQSEDEGISSSAKYMRTSRYLRQGDTQAAQEVLDSIPDKSETAVSLPDKLMLQVSVYLQQNKAELAVTVLEQALFKEASRVHMLLTRLVDAELSAGNVEFARQIAEKTEKMIAVFDLWEYNGYVARCQVAQHERNADAMFPLLERMLEALAVGQEESTSVLYRTMGRKTNHARSEELVSLLLGGLETDPECAYLRKDPRFSDLIAKYKTK